MGTLGSGNHYCEVQIVRDIFDEALATAFGLKRGQICISVHTGSRGLGHQIGTDYMRKMVIEAPTFGIVLKDRELACAPIKSDLGMRYIGAMRAAANCAMANREILTHLVRGVLREEFGDHPVSLLFDVSHNTCKVEQHQVGNRLKTLYVHRKGATRAFGPGHPDLPEALKPFGQPVLIGGSMGTGSYVLAGTAQSEAASFSSACHGAGRAMSRHQAVKEWRGRELQDQLAEQGILIRSPSMRGIAEEAPGAYKDVSKVVEVAERAGLAKRVARLAPLICVKG
jgi:tRNA-splicing ligase RtcB